MIKTDVNNEDIYKKVLVKELEPSGNRCIICKSNKNTVFIDNNTNKYSICMSCIAKIGDSVLSGKIGEIKNRISSNRKIYGTVEGVERAIRRYWDLIIYERAQKFIRYIVNKYYLGIFVNIEKNLLH